MKKLLAIAALFLAVSGKLLAQGPGTGTSGGGGGGGGTVCAGTPLTQAQTGVTSQLSYANTGAGVKVTLLTDNATNRFYYFDVPAYTRANTRGRARN